MKVLLVYRPGDADGVYGMVKGYLDILGIPYATLNTSQVAPAGTIEAATCGMGSTAATIMRCSSRRATSGRR